MPHACCTPFDTIESAQDFVALLSETIVEAKDEIESEFQSELDAAPTRHLDALRIALYNLEKLEKHMASSRRILNDLRSLRRLLFAEREFHRLKPASQKSTIDTETTPAVIALIPPPKPIGVPVVQGTMTARRAIPA